MEDLKKAREILDSSELSLVLVKEEAVLFSSSDKGIRGLMEAIISCGQRIRGASLADRVVGRAAALLVLHGGISSVHARLLSEEAEALLSSHGTTISYDRKVPMILNRTGSGPCPLEEQSRTFECPEEAFRTFSARFPALPGNN
jgi:hypothetical protein